MNKKIFKYLFNIILIILLFLIYIKIDIVKKSVLNTSIIFIKNIFPILFISQIIISLISSSDIIKLFSKNIYIYIFFVSIISGSPNNAIILNNFYNNKYLTIKELNYLLPVTTINNPLFIYNYLKILNINVIRPIIMLYLLNLIPFILIMIKMPKKALKIDNKLNINIIIKNSINNMLTIYGTIVIFKLICDLFIPDISVYACLGKGLIEVTTGLECLSNIKLLSIKKELLTLVILLFTSFSIHIQMSNILPKNTNYKYLYLVKISQIMIMMIYMKIQYHL